MRKLSMILLAGTFFVSLSGCAGISDTFASITETSMSERIADAQAKIDKLTALLGSDLDAAEAMAAKDQLNNAAALQCLPVAHTWLTKLNTQAKYYKNIKGVLSGYIYLHWANQQLNGLPENVTLACSAFADQPSADLSAVKSTISAVKLIFGK